ncbi:LssY C-terminal domain-containing protein [Terriglobus sp. TAA 43]|uniref:LssY C-terminal domain-containing protein n=1 Tax=Terriglobus sp. TAA 43 TaxID=278961 RepID=UPI00068F1367|nr:LssY C-terminal domain-containing protein [Terriglobus sp. TAA 43]
MRRFVFLVLLAVTPVLSAQTARIEAIAPTAPAAVANRKNHATVTVNATKGWIDTGIPLLAGDTLTLKADGTLTLANGQTITPDGKEHFWRDLLRQYPLPTAQTGALIGRIGDNEAAWPFSIGAGETIPVRSNGNLFLAANLSGDLTATGSYKVSITLVPATPGTATSAALSLSQLLQPAIFDTFPRRDDDGQGNAGDAVNFALIGSEQQVQDAFLHSGWFAVDADRNTAILHGLLATLSKEPYREVPMSTLYLFGRPQDMSFARGDTLRVAAERHHLRIWKTTQTVNGQPLWIGSATYDNGFARDSRNGQVTHSIAPAIDTERDFLRDSITSTGAVAAAAYVTPSHPIREATTATGASFHSDGRILVMLLQ